MPRVHRLLCVLFVLATAGAYGVAAGPVDARGRGYVALHLLLCALMLGTWATSRAAGRAEHRWTIAAGALARLVLIAVPPFTSRDVERYLWDGRVAFAGLDPYRLSPDAPALESLRIAWPYPVPVEFLPTLYPPGALALFALAASTGLAWAFWTWKLIVTLASLATLWLVARLARDRGRERHLPLVALSPLLVLEAGVGAHVDTVAALGVAAALGSARGVRASVALAGGALAKLLPAAALLPLAARRGARDRSRLLAGAGAILALGYGVALAAGFRPVGSLTTFLSGARFGSPLFAALAGTLGTAAAWPFAAVALLVALAQSVRRARRGDWRSGVGWALAAPLIASPVVYPWYLMPLGPLLVLVPSFFLLGWVVALPLTYEVIDRPVWDPAAWPLAAVAAAWVVGAALDVASWRRSAGVARPAARRAEVAAETRCTYSVGTSEGP